LHYECEDEPDAIAIGYPEKFFGTHEYVRAARIEELERKLAKCQALMHAGLAEYQRRLVRAVRLIQFLDKEYQHVWGVTAKSEVRTVLAELEGEIDD
jgi:hypothetical protein